MDRAKETRMHASKVQEYRYAHSCLDMTTDGKRGKEKNWGRHTVSVKLDDMMFFCSNNNRSVRYRSLDLVCIGKI